MGETKSQNVGQKEDDGLLSFRNKVQVEEKGQKPKKPLWKRILKGFFCVSLALLLLVVVVLAGGYGVLQTQTGQDFLREKLNAALGKGDGVRVELSSLSGSIPLDMRAGIKLSDANGVWMDCPDSRIKLSLSLERVSVGLAVNDAELFRLPVLPPSQEEPEPASKPLSRKELREILKNLGQQSASLPSWLPSLAIDSLSIARLRVDRPVFNPQTTAEGNAQESFAPPAEAIELGLQATFSVSPRAESDSSPLWSDPRLAGHVQLGIFPRTGKDSSKSDYASSPLCALPDIAFSGTKLGFELSGSLCDPSFSLHLEAPAFMMPGTSVEDAKLSLSLPNHSLPLLAGGDEAGVTLECSASVNKIPVSLKLPLLAALKDAGLVAGFDGLAVSLPGMSLTGGIKALFPPAVLGTEEEIAARKGFASKPALPLPEDILPLLDGGVRLNVANFNLLQGLVPGLALSGGLDASIGFSSATEQAVNLGAKTSGLGVTLKGQAPMALKDFSLGCDVRDLYGQPEGKVDLKLASFKGAGLGLSRIKALLAGGVASGIDYSLGCEGDIQSKIGGHFAPGEVKLSVLDVFYPKMKVGLHSASPATVRYSQEGVSVKGLHLKLLPGGVLRLEGDFGKAACKANGKLEGILFSAYKSIVPQLPEGALDASLQLKGTPERPEGGVVVHLSKLKLPGVALPPLAIDAKADLGHDSVGNRILAGISLPTSTLEALGGKSFFLEVRVPMKNDGSPAPDMDAKLRGKVEYLGDVSKLWKLAGQADRFLTGDIEAHCSLGGTLNAPDASASVQFHRGEFKEVEQGLLVQDINLKASLPAGSKSFLDKILSFSLSASDGKKGKVDFEGNAALTGNKISVKGTIKDFAPLHRKDLKAVFSGNIAVSGSAASPVVNGQINLDRGSLSLESLSVGGSFDTLPLEKKTKEEILAALKKGKPVSVKVDSKSQKGASAPKTKEVKQGPGNIDIVFHMAPRFSISGFGLESLWRADLKVKGNLSDIGVMGEVMAVKGSLNLLNRQFTLATGTVSFFGGLEPFLNIKMIHQASELEVAVNLQGSPRKLDVSLSSTPEKPQDEIISRMLFNKSKNDLSNYELMQLGVAAAKLAFFAGGGNGGMLDKVKDVAGIDVVNIGQAEGGGAKMEFGKYLNEKVYIGVEKTTGSKGDTSGLVQYEFGPRTSATVKTSGKNTSAGFKWKLDY